MLPFHKRIRSNSVTEVDLADIELVDLPKVSAPSPRFTVRPAIKFASHDDERTMLMPEKRRSTAPPAARIPSVRVPPMGMLPNFGPSLSMTDDVTQVRPGARRSLLTMKAAPAHRMSINSMMREELASQLEPAMVPPARASESIPAMAITAADASSATVLVRNNAAGRPTAVWAMALLAMGLFGGLLTSMVTRNELAASAAPVQAAAPARQDVVANSAAAIQAPIAQREIPAAIADALGTPSTPACGVDPVPAPRPTPTAKAIAVAAWTPPVVDKPEIKPEIKPTPRVTVARVARPAPAPAVKSEVVVAAVAKPAPKPATNAKKALGDDMEQANAADALARAQLEAALSR